MVVKAITTTVIGLANPASTAACPTTNTPTMERAPPTCLGSRTVASLNISIAISIINTSTTAGYGTPALPPATATANSVGNSSGLNAINETYNEGKTSENTSASIRANLAKVPIKNLEE